ncbi:MAG: type VI secretion system contractile sheath small subunit [Francisellaceae bacterium]
MAVNKDIPKSRITITYDMEVDGVKKKKELPFKQLVIGDLSLGNSNDRNVALASRQIHDVNNASLADVMKAMDIKLNLRVPNHVTNDEAKIDVKLKFDSMKAFEPNQIANAIPELQMLIEIKRLITEFDSLVDNNRKLRNLINRSLNNETALKQIQSQLPESQTYRLTAQPMNQKED